MTITIDIKPEVQAGLDRQAAAHRVNIAAYAAKLLEEAARTPSGSKKISETQLENTLRELAQFSIKIPLLSDEAFPAGAYTGITTDAGGRLLSAR